MTQPNTQPDNRDYAAELGAAVRQGVEQKGRLDLELLYQAVLDLPDDYARRCGLNTTTAGMVVEHTRRQLINALRYGLDDDTQRPRSMPAVLDERAAS